MELSMDKYGFQLVCNSEIAKCQEMQAKKYYTLSLFFPN